MSKVSAILSIRSFLKTNHVGICTNIDRGCNKVTIEFMVFQQVVERNFNYLKKYCCLALPPGDEHSAYL